MLESKYLRPCRGSPVDPLGVQSEPPEHPSATVLLSEPLGPGANAVSCCALAPSRTDAQGSSALWSGYPAALRAAGQGAGRDFLGWARKGVGLTELAGLDGDDRPHT
jgi:hypothetical protein